MLILWVAGEVFRGDDDVVLEPTSYVMEVNNECVPTFLINLSTIRLL